MPPQQVRRMPMSCENCRRRKIRCHGNQVPCETCVRRGRGTSCHFLRDDNPVPVNTASNTEKATLLGKISNLEQLLQQQIELSNAILNRHDQDQRHVTVGVFTPSESSQYSSTERSQPHIIGRIATDPNGYTRYVPGTLSTGVDAGLLEHIYPASSTAVSSDSGSNLFLPDAPNSQQQLLDLLPSMTLCDALKGVFCNVFSPLFHILHDPSFEALYQNFRASPEHTPLSSLALIFVVIAIATTALTEDDPLLRELGHDTNTSAKVRRLTAKYQSAALRCLASDNFMWRHTLATLQSLILLIYSFSHTRGPAWSLLGATFNIAVALGCHVDPAQLEGLSVVESEERRRCWAGLMLLHTIQNTCLGNVAPVIVTASVQLPADVEDEDLTTHSPTSPSKPTRRLYPSKMAYILHKFKLYQLASEICQLTTSTASSAPRINALHSRIAIQQSDQQARFSNIPSLPIYHQAHFHILTIYTNHLFILLHRPCLKTAASIDDSPPITTPPHTASSLNQVIFSATTILDHHLALATTPSFAPYRWYTHGVGAFHALLAASALIVAASDPRAGISSPGALGMVVGRGRQGERPAQREGGERLELEVGEAVVPLLRRCVESLKAGEGRSEICRLGARFLGEVLGTVGRESGGGGVGASGSTGGGAVDWLRGRGGDGLCSPSAVVGPGSAAGDGLLQQESRQRQEQQQRYREFQYEHVDASLEAMTSAENGRNIAPMYTDVDLDGWTPPQKLVELVSGGANQQWLAPSSFAWDAWFSDDVFGGSSVPTGMPAGVQMV